jgi:HlyD family secretion protein
VKLRSKVFWVLAVGAFIGFVAWALRPQPVSVETVEVTQGTFEQTVDEDGKTRVRDRYLLAAPLGGRIMRVGLKAGDAIEAGEVVTTIVPQVPSLQDARTVRELEERAAAVDASRMRAAAMEERARSGLMQARIDADRNTKLAQEGFLSAAGREQSELALRLRERELEAARYERVAAERELAQARAALSRVRDEPQSGRPAGRGFEVRAPISGRVLRVLQESAGPVTVGTGLVEIADVSRLEAVIDVLSTEAITIPANADVYLDTGLSGDAVKGRVRRIEPSAFTKVSALGVEEQRVNVIVDFLDPTAAQALGDGYRVDARIVVYRASDAVLVPTGAIFRDGPGYAVFVIDGGHARKRSIDVPRRNARQAVVVSGLNSGERVVAFPGDTVADGVRVEVRAPASR